MNEVFAEKVVTDRRTYFFDVKETREGSLYLVIGEVAQVGNDTARHRVMVFEENIDSFLRGLQKSVAHIKGVTQPAPVESDGNVHGEPPAEPSARNGGSVREILGQIGFGRARREQPDDDESARATLKRIEAALMEIRGHFS